MRSGNISSTIQHIGNAASWSRYMSELFQSAIGSSRDRGDAPVGVFSSATYIIRFAESYVIQLGCPPIVTLPFVTNVYPPPLVGVNVSDWTVPWYWETKIFMAQAASMRAGSSPKDLIKGCMVATIIEQPNSFGFRSLCETKTTSVCLGTWRALVIFIFAYTSSFQAHALLQWIYLTRVYPFAVLRQLSQGWILDFPQAFTTGSSGFPARQVKECQVECLSSSKPGPTPQFMASQFFLAGLNS